MRFGYSTVRIWFYSGARRLGTSSLEDLLVLDIVSQGLSVRLAEGVLASQLICAI
jgi:hypothetical protein